MNTNNKNFTHPGGWFLVVGGWWLAVRFGFCNLVVFLSESQITRITQDFKRFLVWNRRGWEPRLPFIEAQQGM